MKNKKIVKFTGIIALFVVIFVGGYFTIKNIVKGAEGDATLVTGDPMNIDVVLTRQDQCETLAFRPEPTLVPTAPPVSGGEITVTPLPSATPTPIPLPEMPSCTGGENTKGKEENPFVVLEVVPDLAAQNMGWLSASSAPLDDFELSHRLAEHEKKSVKQLLDHPNLSNAKVLFEATYTAWDIEQKQYVKKKPYSYRKLYEIESSGGFGSADFNGVPQKYLDDKYNWETSLSSSTAKKSGYVIRTSTGNLRPDFNSKTLTTSQNPGEREWCWEFVTTLPEGAICIDDKIASTTNYVANHLNEIAMNSYFTATDWSLPVTTYSYYNLVNNDILKYTLLDPYIDDEGTEYKTKEDFDNYHMKVVTVTATQLNELAKYDTPDTLDYIERADLVYINTMDSGTDSQQRGLANFYIQYIEDYINYSLGNQVRVIDGNGYPTFMNSGDIEWSVCMRLIKKLSIYMDFPMLINSAICTECEKYRAHTYLYVDTKNTTNQCMSQNASLTNAAKVFYIASEFNLLARKSGPPEELSDTRKSSYVYYFSQISEYYTSGGAYQGERTFMEDIYPNIKQIKLTTPNGNCEYTGYYERELCNENDKTAFYLWNELTFYPTSKYVYDLWDEVLKGKYGYLETFAFNKSKASDTTEKYPTNAENFRGTDAKRDKKHLQNVVALAVNQCLFNFTDYFTDTMEALRNIINAKALSANELEVKISKVSKVNSYRFAKYLKFNMEADYEDTVRTTVYFDVKNSNNIPGVFSVYRIKESAVEKLSSKYRDDAWKEENPDYIKPNDCLSQEISVFDEKTDAWKPVTYVDYNAAAIAESELWKPAAAGSTSDEIMVPKASTVKYKLEYRIKHDWQGINNTNTAYPQILFACQAQKVRFKKSADGTKISDLPTDTKISDVRLDFYQLGLFNLE